MFKEASSILVFLFLFFVNSGLKNSAVSLLSYILAKGIQMAYFCYRKNLSIVGNCRLCFVEVKNAPKPMISCTSNPKNLLYNNVVHTDSALIKKARENVLEFLLLNHPLDCPICDMAGCCDLQDQSTNFGAFKKRFRVFKRVVSNKNLGRFIKTIMTRCIHCTRCVRFTDEILNKKLLGTFNRGKKSQIGSYLGSNFLISKSASNIVNLCPVGFIINEN